MYNKRPLGKMGRRVLANFLLIIIIITASLGGSALPRIEVAAEDSNILSGTDRNVIFSNSRTDFRDESIYFTMVTRYYNGDESNDAQCWDGTQYNLNDPAWRGDFKGLIEKLDYIKALGFTAIWITPVVENASGYDYHGYHAINFSKVDPRYESEDCTYQDLIDACHAKGLKIIQDVVFNHTGNFGEENLFPMFKKEGDLSSVDSMKQVENSGLPANYDSLTPGQQYNARIALMKNTDGKNNDVNNIYHHFGNFNWDDYTSQLAQIAGDCVDLNTENPLVYNYLIDAYSKYIDMGVDGFRVDTVRHISRLTFNKVFNEAFLEAGRRNGKDFFMFGEVCTRDNGNYWYRQSPSMSTPFYTWKDTKDYPWSDTDWEINYNSAIQNTRDNADASSIANQPTSQNAFLNGNEYHGTDYSQFSGMNVIDFPMHWSFKSAESAFAVAKNGDRYYNDATWNVTYVDSHDYSPDGAPEDKRFDQDQSTWAENLNLMFTFRGIPCIYYGTETEFKKGATIDKGPNIALENSGRAYYGDNLEGTITAIDFGEYGNVSGAIGDTLKHPLSQHIQRLNRIRQAIPALRKGQYSTEGVSGSLAFKRRYTDATTDSFVCVSISGNATFSGIPNGRYVDAITGDVKNVTNGTLNVNVSGKGNLKVYVLDTNKTPAPGRVVTNGKYLTDGGAIKDIEPIEVDVINPTGITLDNTSLSIMEGTTQTVKATVAPKNATNKVVSWTSNNPSVATVSGGTITGIANGNAIITAKTSNGLTARVNVTVTINPNIVNPSGIVLNNTSLSLIEGESDSLIATVMPTNATNKTVQWTSSDSSIATVSNSGKLTAVSEGRAIITATTFNGYKAIATVIVDAKEIPTIDNGIYFEKPANWNKVNVYFFNSATNSTVGAAWPGVEMSDLGDGVFGLPYTSSDPNLMMVFNNGAGSQTGDLKYINNGYYNVNGFVKVVKPSTDSRIYFEKPTNWNKVNVYFFNSATDSTVGAAWPGVEMSDLGEGVFGLPYTSSDPNLMMVFNNGAGSQTGDLKYTDNGYYNVNGFVKVVEAPAQKGKVTINYVDDNGNVMSSQTITGDIGVAYTSTAKSFDGYVLKTTPDNASGKYTANTITVIYRYEKIKEQELSLVLKINGGESNITTDIGSKLNISASASGGSGDYKYSFLVHNKDTNIWHRFSDFTNSNVLTWTAASAGNREFFVEVKDSTGKLVRSSAIGVMVGSIDNSLAITGTSSASDIKVGEKITITATASGGSGNYTYRFRVFNNDTNESYVFSDFNKSNVLIWTAGSKGNRDFFVEVKDSTGKIVKSKEIQVKVTK